MRALLMNRRETERDMMDIEFKCVQSKNAQMFNYSKQKHVVDDAMYTITIIN